MANDKIKFQSPFLTAKYPHISEPDTVGKFADGKYKVKLVGNLGDKDTQDFIRTIDDAVSKFWGNTKGVAAPYEINEDSGEVTFGVFKTQYAPTVFDGRGNQIGSDVRLGGGSIIRILGNLGSYESGRNKGVNATFSQVQVKSLSGGSASFGFEAVDDGYEYDGEVAPRSEFTSSSRNESGGGNSALDI